jgi:hypothetical protein
MRLSPYSFWIHPTRLPGLIRPTVNSAPTRSTMTSSVRCTPGATSELPTTTQVASDLQHPLGKNLQGQFNYTFSKSLDEASAAERIGPYEGTGGTGNDLNGDGIVINSWDPLSLRGLSDFNAKHQINANWAYSLPFGKGQRLAGNASPFLIARIGGWQFSGLFRLEHRFPHHGRQRFRLGDQLEHRRRR